MAQTSVLTSGNNGWAQALKMDSFGQREKYKTKPHLFGLRGQSVYNLFKYAGALEFGWLWGCGEKENYPAFSTSRF